MAVRPEASSLPASAPRAAGVVVPALQAAFPQEEECAGAANARSAEEFATAEPAHSGWDQADCSAVVSPDGSIPDGYSAALLADGPVDCSAELSAGGSIPLGQGERRCSLDARPQGRSDQHDGDGFFTSEIGIKYLDYIGSAYLKEFPGCPPVPES